MRHPRLRTILGPALLALSLAPTIPARGDGPAKPAPKDRAARLVAARLDAWKGRPEWAAMLADILKGSQLGPKDGWFTVATSRTRFTWPAARARLDRDGDGVIARAEFPGPDPDFARADRDRDAVLTEADFDWSAHALTPSPGLILFYRSDMDGDGRVTRKELDAFFAQSDRDRAGFLSLDDLKAAFTPPARRPGQVAEAGPTKATLVRGLFRQEIGSLNPGPKLDTPAPDFTLKTVDGTREVTLSKLVGPKPVVLVFGNFTCGPFRAGAGDVEKLYHRYKDRAEFAMIYVREAHPTDGWHMSSNDRVGVSLPQPLTDGERVSVAQTCRRTLGFDMPFLVDTITDKVGTAYSGMPSRLYLIDRGGKVAFQSGRGPFGFKPAELEQALVLMLATEETAAAAASAASSPALADRPR